MRNVYSKLFPDFVLIVIFIFKSLVFLSNLIIAGFEILSSVNSSSFIISYSTFGTNKNSIIALFPFVTFTDNLPLKIAF